MSEMKKSGLSQKHQERLVARNELNWMYTAAVNAHQALLRNQGVTECDLQRFSEQNNFRKKSRKQMCKLILQVMRHDQEFAKFLMPHMHIVALLSEEES